MTSLSLCTFYEDYTGNFVVLVNNTLFFYCMKVHISGVGDFNLSGVTSLPDPCPLPSAAKKKGLRDKEKLFYAPMSGLGDLLYDKDAVYINIHDHLVQFSKADDGNEIPMKKGNYAFSLHEVDVLQSIK